MGRVSDRYRVERLGMAVCRAVMERKHYLRSLGSFLDGFGMWHEEDGLVGVICYGQPSPPVYRAFRGRDFGLYSLSRLVMESGHPASILIVRSAGMLRRRPCAIVSYADAGMGHVGIVYQAVNWLYTGMVRSHDDMYLIDGVPRHSLTVVRGMGITAPKRWARENGIEVVRSDWKHRYVGIVGNRWERSAILAAMSWPVVRPYPKGDRVRYDDGPPLRSCVPVDIGRGVRQLALL